MTGICRLCRQLVSGTPAMELGERTEREISSLARAALSHVSDCHREVVARVNEVLLMAGAYMALLVLELPTDAAVTRHVFFEAVGLAISGLEPQIHHIPEAPGQGAPQ